MRRRFRRYLGTCANYNGTCAINVETCANYNETCAINVETCANYNETCARSTPQKKAQPQ